MTEKTQNNNELTMESAACKARPHLIRQLSIINPETVEKTRFLIVGCGAIGSYTALALAQMGAEKITIFDNDSFDELNRSSQLCKIADIGTNKAKALADTIKQFTGVEATAVDEKFEAGNEYHYLYGEKNAIVILAVDSMAARKEIAEAIINTLKDGQVSHIIDPRMSAEKYSQFVCKLSDKKSVDTYKATLYTDGEAVQERCTAKATIYTSMSSAGLITKTVKNILEKETYPKTLHWNLKDSHLDVMQMFGAN